MLLFQKFLKLIKKEFPNIRIKMLKSEKIKSNLIPTDNSNKKENLFIEKTETLKKQQQKVILSKRDVELKGYNFIRKKISEAYRDKKIYKI